MLSLKREWLWTGACAALAWAGTTGCASVPKFKTETEMQTMLANQNVQPPLRGQNKVYVEFMDQTGEGNEFEDRIYDLIVDKVQSRGYEVAPYDEADYLLWATVRIFTEGPKGEGSAAAAGLGAIAGGVGGAAVSQALDLGPTASWASTIGGAAVGGTTGYVLSKEECWTMVLDLQVGRKATEEVRTTIRVEDQKKLVQASVVAANAGAVNNLDAGAGGTTTTTSSEYVDTSIFFELAQRFCAQASASAMFINKEKAADKLVERISNGISSCLPRYRAS